MKLGIIGLPQSGKTTIFNALTRGNTPTSASAGRIEVHNAVVNVPDLRVDQLSAIFNPKKTVYAKITYTDVAGLDGSAGKTGISGQLLNQLSQMDGFIHVVRAFDNDNVLHSALTIDPQRDIETMESEFILNDMIAVERKLERLKDEHRKGSADKTQAERQISLFDRLHTYLSDEKPLRDADIGSDESKLISGFGFLSRKPMLILLNLGEGQIEPILETPLKVVGLQGKLEMEIAQLPPDDAAIFMEEYNITEPSLNRMIRLSYDLLNLQSFFTVGEDECRAWTVRRGANAFEAAGEVHTDLQRGFIRAEVIPFVTLAELGSMAEARNRGKLRLEGKEYIVQDGDIVHVRFSV